jgi:hypothetical protein
VDAKSHMASPSDNRRTTAAIVVLSGSGNTKVLYDGTHCPSSCPCATLLISIPTILFRVLVLGGLEESEALAFG